jgi:MFS superfamily sulfate permease-like transporter
MTAEQPPGSSGRRAVGDIVGGIVGGLYSVPEGLGYASLAGISPVLGIYAGMTPVAVAAATTGPHRRPGDGHRADTSSGGCRLICTLE